MSVVNVKVANIRPHYRDLKCWTESAKNKYTGRRGIVFVNGERFPKTDSLWANPFKISKTLTREDVLRKYEEYILDKIKREGLQERLLELRGKKLGCWCKPEKCHGDILLKLIEKAG